MEDVTGARRTLAREPRFSTSRPAQNESQHIRSWHSGPGRLIGLAHGAATPWPPAITTRVRRAVGGCSTPVNAGQVFSQIHQASQRPVRHGAQNLGQ
jgi:hypothetical protein